MKKIALLLLFTGIINAIYSQNLEGFDAFIGGKWKTKGQWGDGTPFVQEISFSKALEGRGILVDTKGFVDKENKKMGQRNFGIRKWNSALARIEFWEFDVFGGVTKGHCWFQNQNLYYQYSYGEKGKETLLTEAWIYVSKEEYIFKVGEYSNQQWREIYLETTFVRKK